MRNRLTTEIIAAAPLKENTYTMVDGDRLNVSIYPAGGKTFVFRWTIKNTKIKKTITIGTFPDIDLEYAREEAQKYRTWLAKGKDPQEELKRSKLSFEAVVRLWHEDQFPEQEKQHAINVIRRFEKHLIPKLGKVSVGSLEYSTIDQILDLLTAPIAKSLRTNLINLNKWALQRKLCTDLFVFTKKRSHTVKNRSAATTTDELRPIIQKINKHHAKRPYNSITNALLLSPMLPVRREDLVSMEWEDIEFKDSLWHMRDSKSGKDVFVPLSEPVVVILEQLKTYAKTQWVFPALKGHITGRSLLRNLREAGVSEHDQDIHGFRATFHTMMGEKGYPYELREMCIAHVGKSYNGAYDRTNRLPERREIMKVWAQTIGELK